MRKEQNTEYEERSKAWFGDSLPVSADDMAARTWRFPQLVPSRLAYPDCSLEGHARTIYSALGHGPDDEEAEGIAVEKADDFFVDFVKAEPGNGAALHSHGTEEAFIALTGSWEIFWGDNGKTGTILHQFDGIVVPPGVMRGFRNAGDSEALLLAILGARHAGHCVWAKSLMGKFHDRSAVPAAHEFGLPAR